MHQVVVRILAPQVSVFDFAFGQIVDGQFTPLDCGVLPENILKHIHLSNLLGTAAFLESTQLSALASALLDAGCDMTFYPSFIVFNLPEGYVSKEEKNS